MKFLRKMKKGFTIVELVIVIAVIAVLTAILVPTFINISKKANKASDNSLVTNLNTALKMAEGDNEIYDGHKLSDENVTMHDAVLDLKAYGYYLEQLVTKSSEDLLYSLKENKFYLSGDSEINSKYASAAEKVQYLWTVKNSIAGDEKYSVYAGAKWSQAVITNLHVGFDAGYRTDISSISYSNSSAQKVIIRTNSGDISVEAPSDTVKHYGKADSVDIIKIASTSYHEYGEVGYANIANGRLVFEESSNVEGVYLVANQSGEFDDIKLAVVGDAVLPTLARADVELQDGESLLVVEVQTLATSDGTDANPEYIWITGTSSGSADVTISTSNDKDHFDDQDKVVTEPTEAAEQASKTVDESATPITDNSIARIGAIGYESLDAAFSAAKSGDTITLLNNANVNQIITIDEDVSLTLDLNGFTLINNVTSSQYVTYHTYSMWPAQYGTANATGRAFVLLDGSSLVINANDGEMVIPESNANSYGFFRVYAASLVINGGTIKGNTDNGSFIHMKAYSCGDVELNNVTGETNYRFIASDNQVYGKVSVIGGTFTQHNDGLSTPSGTIPAFWICQSRALFQDTEITSYWGECVCLNSSYTSVENEEDMIVSFFKGNNKFTVLANNTIQSWNCCAIGIESNAIANVESGIYNGYKYGAYIFTSNGHLNVSGGTFIGSTASVRVDHNDNNYKPETKPSILITGGDFKGALMRGNDTIFSIEGGTFNVDPTDFLADGYVATEHNGSWTVHVA